MDDEEVKEEEKENEKELGDEEMLAMDNEPLEDFEGDEENSYDR